MKAEWIDFCRCDDFRIDGEFVEVIFANERRQRVRIEDQADAYRVFSVAARADKLNDFSNPALVAWERNRSLSLMGFRVDERGRMIGEAWVPKIGLTAEEFQLYIRTVALECDRFEFQLTGRDVE
jgi:hypothetical protein